MAERATTAIFPYLRAQPPPRSVTLTRGRTRGIPAARAGKPTHESKYPRVYGGTLLLAIFARVHFVSLPLWILHRKDADRTEMPAPELSGGTLNAALANDLGKLIAGFIGRGAHRSGTFLHRDDG